MKIVEDKANKIFGNAFLNKDTHAHINHNNTQHQTIVSIFTQCTIDFFNNNCACFVGVENAYQTIKDNATQKISRILHCPEDVATLIIEIYSYPLYATIRTIYKSLI